MVPIGVTIYYRAPADAEIRVRMAQQGEFAFRPLEDRWSPDRSQVTRVKAQLGEISIVGMPAYGEHPEEAQQPGYGPLLEQMAGLTWLQGYEGGPPQRSGIAYGDPVAGSAASWSTDQRTVLTAWAVSPSVVLAATDTRAPSKWPIRRPS